MDMKFFLNLF